MRRVSVSNNNKEKAENYKNIILNKYPDTEYAKIIKDPEYGKVASKNLKEAELFYSETYKLYSEKAYKQVIENCEKSDSIYANNHLADKFHLLRAFSIGKTESESELKNALIGVTIKHPNTPSQVKAQELIDLIDSKSPPTIKDSATTSREFIYNENTEHSCVIVCSEKDLKQLKISEKINKINTEKYDTLKLAVLPTSFKDSTQQMLTIQSFKDKKEAMGYFNFIGTNKDIFAGLKSDSYSVILISRENYAILLKEQNIVEYKKFFSLNYK